jgi:hypothetical protein
MAIDLNLLSPRLLAKFASDLADELLFKSLTAGLKETILALERARHGNIYCLNILEHIRHPNSCR